MGKLTMLIFIMLTMFSLSLFGGNPHLKWCIFFNKVIESSKSEAIKASRALKLIDRRCVDKKFEEAAYYTLLAIKRFDWPRARYAAKDALNLYNQDDKETVNRIEQEKKYLLDYEESSNESPTPPLFDFNEKWDYSSDDSIDSPRDINYVKRKDHRDYDEWNYCEGGSAHQFDEDELTIFNSLRDYYSDGYHLRAYDEQLPTDTEKLLLNNPNIAPILIFELFDKYWLGDNPTKFNFDVFKRKLFFYLGGNKPLPGGTLPFLDTPATEHACSPHSKECTIEGFFFWKKKNEEDASNSTEQISDNQATNPHEKRDFAKEKKAITQARISITILTL